MIEQQVLAEGEEIIDLPDDWYSTDAFTDHEGISLLPALQDESLPERTVFWKYLSQAAIRKGRWKAIRSGENWELYNMGVDGTELNDLSAEHPELVEDLAKDWERWAQRTHVYPDPRNRKKLVHCC